MNCSPRRDHWSQGCNWTSSSSLFRPPFWTPSPSTRTSGTLGGLPDGMTKTLTPERPQPLGTTYFPGQGCALVHLPSKLTNSTKGHPRGPCDANVSLCLLLCNGSPPSSWWPRTLTHLLACWPLGTRSLKCPGGSSSLQFNGTQAVTSSGNNPVLRTKLSKFL